MPRLPGYSFHDPTKTNFHRSQLFAVKGGGHMTESTAPLAENIDSDVVRTIRNVGTPPEVLSGTQRPVYTP